jgi:hypothetical protein
MKSILVLLAVIAGVTLAACESQRLAQCDPSCPNGEAARKEAPSPVNPPWWADPRDR